MTCKGNMKCTFQCPYIKYYQNLIMPSDLCGCFKATTVKWSSWKRDPSNAQKQKYSLSVPLQEKLVTSGL